MSAPSIVGVVPAAGRGARLPGLPCSKEIYPISLDDQGRPRPVGRWLLDAMAKAGAGHAVVLVGEDKWDILRHLGDGRGHPPPLAYVPVGRPDGVPNTVAHAIPFVADATVLFGFPDMILEPDDVLARVLGRLDDCDADIVLGLFRTSQPDKVDIVETDADDVVREVHIKPGDPGSGWTWTLAAWRPTFTAALGAAVAEWESRGSGMDWQFAHAIRWAIQHGLRVDAERLHGARYLDIGTPDDLAAALSTQSSGPRPIPT